MNFRNMLSAHTTNREDGPLWPNGNLAKCFRGQRVHGGIKGHLHIPHSFETGDNLVLMPCSDLHPDTKAAKKETWNEAWSFLRIFVFCYAGLISPIKFAIAMAFLLVLTCLSSPLFVSSRLQ
jgi:hypothetical protein